MTALDIFKNANDGIDRIIAERDAATAERAHYGDVMTARLGQCENERDAARAELFAARSALLKEGLEGDAARAEAAELREQVLRLRDACESVAQNMEVSGQLWSSWHTSIAIARLRDALDMTASDNSSHVAP